jgi:hypothetical protein
LDGFPLARASRYRFAGRSAVIANRVGGVSSRRAGAGGEQLVVDVEVMSSEPLTGRSGIRPPPGRVTALRRYAMTFGHAYPATASGSSRFTISRLTPGVVEYETLEG